MESSDTRLPAAAARRRSEYEEYLRSPHWRSLRVQVLERDGYRCCVCNSPESLDVHHRTYRRFGRERLGDLTTLCHECHGIFHRARRKVGGAQADSQRDVERIVLAWVAEHDRPDSDWTAAGIAGGLAISKGKVKAALHALRARGEVIQGTKGRWYLAPEWSSQRDEVPARV